MKLVHRWQIWWVDEKNTKFKEYWNAELSNKWALMHNAEKCYKQARIKGDNCGIKRGIFLHARKRFNKLLVKKKRSYCNGLLEKMEKCNTSNPTDFWNFVKKLGPNCKYEIPWEVVKDGLTITNRDEVLEHWRCVFEKLYQSSHQGFNDNFKNEKLKEIESVISQVTD